MYDLCTHLKIHRQPKPQHSPFPTQTKLLLSDSDKSHILQQPQLQQPLLFSWFSSSYYYVFLFKFINQFFSVSILSTDRQPHSPSKKSLSLPLTSFFKGDGAPGAYLRQQIKRPGVSFSLCFVLCSFHNLKTPFNFLLPVIPSIVEGSHYAPEKY